MGRGVGYQNKVGGFLCVEFEKTSKGVGPWRGTRVVNSAPGTRGRQRGAANLGELARRQCSVNSGSRRRSTSRLAGAARGAQLRQRRMWGRGARPAGDGAGAVGVG